MATNLELYEELKKSLTEDAARMIAETVPSAGDLATKADLVRLEHASSRIERRIDKLEARLLRWVLVFFVPLWVGILGACITLAVALLGRT
jgi:hypothetical protein